MSRLFRNNPETREGKYPVLLRRDGTVPEWEWFVLGARDPAAPFALRAYAERARTLGMDPQYVADIETMAESWDASQRAEADERMLDAQATRYADDPRNMRLTELPKPADPDGPRHRTDDPDVLDFPASLQTYRERLSGRGVL